MLLKITRSTVVLVSFPFGPKNSMNDKNNLFDLDINLLKT